MSERNKEIVGRFVTEWLRNRDANALQQLCHPDLEFDWGILGSGRGIAELCAREESARVAFPDLNVSTRLMIAENDIVVNVSDVTGTHCGPWLGIAPTGRTIRWTAAEIYRLSARKISHQWLVEDWASVLQELGAR